MRTALALLLALSALLVIAMWRYDRVASSQASAVRLGVEPADVELARRLCRDHGRDLPACSPFDGSAVATDSVLRTLD